MEQNKKYYDEFFSIYPVNIHDNRDRFTTVSGLLKGSVLDVACGTGTLADYYSGNYYGVDFSDVAIIKARKTRRKDAFFDVCDVTLEMIKSDDLFDSVYIGEFLEHIKKDDFVFQNIIHKCKKNARIVVSVPNYDKVPDESHCRIFTVPQIRKDYSKYGKITFHNWGGFSKRILFSIELGKKNTDEMSLVMIVKNEEKGLERAILSAIDLVDRVVISVDTLSKDKTDGIAKMYADELKFHEWHDDFSEARNYAQENVKSRWIIFLDGHEYIQDYGNIKEFLQKDVEGIFVNIKMESGMTFLFPRIYRSYVKFKNKVHNVNECKTRRACPSFLIIHDREFGQDKESAEIRNRQREEILPRELDEQLKENPKNARAHFHFANFYMMRHEIDKAMEHYKKAIKYGKSPDEKYISLLHYGALHNSKGNKFRALWNFQKADELLPDRWESKRVIGGFYLMEKNFKKALPLLFDSLRQNKRHYAYEPMKQDKSQIWDMIGHCFAHMDQNENALTAFERAKEETSDKKRKAFLDQKIKLVKTLVV